MRFSDFLFPAKCVFCGRILGADETGACHACSRRLPFVTEPVCVHCGKPLEDEREAICHDCRLNPDTALDASRALWVYREDTKAAMMDFKYGGCSKDAEYYADELANRFLYRVREWEPDVIVPIPIYWRRAWFRGYNQAEQLASVLGEKWGLPVCELLRRTRGTAPQKALDPAERRRNLRQVFAIDEERPGKPDYRRILLIDDVYTTGATLDTAAHVLKEAGAERVFGLCLCIGSGR